LIDSWNSTTGYYSRSYYNSWADTTESTGNPYYYAEYELIDTHGLDLPNQYFNFPFKVVPSAMPVVDPSKMPVVHPSKMPVSSSDHPTAAPTKSELFQFTVTQGLNGINASSFSTNASLAFKETVADCLTGITSDDVSITSVVGVSSSRRLRALTTWSIDVTYVVTADPFKLGFTNITAAFSALKSELLTATADSQFTDDLQANALVYDSSALSSVTADSSPTISNPVEVTSTTSSSSSKKKNNTPLIVGLVVGLGGGLILIAVCAFVIMSRRSNKIMSS